MKLISMLLLFIIMVGTSFAGTPPKDCVSITGFYERAPEDKSYYSFTRKEEYANGYLSYFRAFVPPGTVLMDLNIIENGKQMSVARFNTPPTGLPTSPKLPYGSFYTLETLRAHDCWSITNWESSLYITNDAFPPLADDKAGWLYVKVDGGMLTQLFELHFSARVDVKEYNKWWDANIKNEAGWNTLVQNVESYSLKDLPNCDTASLDDKLVLNIPYLLFSGHLYKAKLEYEYNAEYPTLIIFKATLFEKISDDINCQKSTMSNVYSIHIPETTIYNSNNRLSLDLEYVSILSTNGSVRFAISGWKEL